MRAFFKILFFTWHGLQAFWFVSHLVRYPPDLTTEQGIIQLLILLFINGSIWVAGSIIFGLPVLVMGRK